MKLIFLTLITLSISQAKDFSFSLEVTYPDSEKKTFIVDDGKFDIKLQSEKWRCIVSPIDKSDKSNIGRVILCDGPSDTRVVAGLTCKKRMERSSAFAIFESNRSHNLRLFCR